MKNENDEIREDVSENGEMSYEALVKKAKEMGIPVMETGPQKSSDSNTTEGAGSSGQVQSTAAEDNRKIEFMLESIQRQLLDFFGQLRSESRAASEPHVPPPTDNEAVQVFAVMKTLADGDRSRKAPLLRVMLLLVLDGLSQIETAQKCQCHPSLITIRVREIERRFKRPLKQLQAMASQLRELTSVEDWRARRIYQHEAGDE